MAKDANDIHREFGLDGLRQLGDRLRDEPLDDQAKPNGKAPGARARAKATTLPPPPDRPGLLLSAWLNKPIPLRDFLLGGVLCTTSRWFIFGETGIGKTLVAMQMAGAIAAGASFLKWVGQRRGRVMYLDGEMPMGTFKERMQLVADRYGSEIELYGYNRDALGDEACRRSTRIWARLGSSARLKPSSRTSSFSIPSCVS
jgi:hypothetical protein